MKTKLLLFTVLLLLCSNLFAQGDFQIGNLSFDESKVLLYMSPYEGLLNSSGDPAQEGDYIHQWIDQSPYGFVFSNPSESKRPLLASENGELYLDFSDGDFLENTTIKNRINGLDEFTIFIVIKSDNSDTDSGFLDSEDPDGKDDLVALRYDKHGANTGHTNCLKAGLNSNSSNYQVETEPYTQSTDHQVIAMTWKKHERLQVFVNGVLSGSSNHNYSGNISSIKKLIIGKGPKDIDSNSGWDGKVGELFFYKEKLSNELIESTSSTLPVELSYFDGDFEDKSVVLDWVTLTEINNSHFTIERSSNAFDFEVLEEVSGNGNSNSEIKYQFIDMKPNSGVNYYRLKQTDFNGKSETFEPISVYVPEKQKGDIISFEVFPNPISIGQPLSINIHSLGNNEYAKINVRSVSGENVFNDEIRGSESSYRSSVNGLRVGIYFLTISTEQNEYSIKLIVR